MNATNAQSAPLQVSDVMQTARQASQTNVLLGVMLVALGILSVMAPLFTGVTVTILVGMYLVAAGCIEMYFAFKAPSFGKGALKFLFGGVGVVAGFVTFALPIESLQTLTLILAGLFIVGGIVEIVLALNLKKEDAVGWAWLLFSGIASILLAVLIFAQWPMSGLWAVGVIVGTRILFHGLTLISLGSAGGKAVRYAEDIRVDVLEQHIRKITRALQETQVIVAGQTLALLVLDAELRQKVSTGDVDPAIQEINQKLGEARVQMQQAADQTQEAWDAAQKEANTVFESLQKSASALTERLKKDLGTN